jgi:hypothetical protein
MPLLVILLLVTSLESKEAVLVVEVIVEVAADEEVVGAVDEDTMEDILFEFILEELLLLNKGEGVLYNGDLNFLLETHILGEITLLTLEPEVSTVIADPNLTDLVLLLLLSLVLFCLSFILLLSSSNCISFINGDLTRVSFLNDFFLFSTLPVKL